MSSVHVWASPDRRVEVEWNKSAPHWRVLWSPEPPKDGYWDPRSIGYATREAAVAAAKRRARKIA